MSKILNCLRTMRRGGGHLSCFFSFHSRVLVQHFQAVLCCFLNDRCPRLDAQRPSKIQVVQFCLVFHAFKIVHISYNKGVFARFPCFKPVSFFRTVSNVRHGNIISESTANTSIDTPWLSPAFWNSEKSVALVPDESFQTLLFFSLRIGLLSSWEKMRRKFKSTAS